MTRKDFNPDQGFLFDVIAESPGIEAHIGFGPEQLDHGYRDGDSTDISRYLRLYVDAVRQLGRGRSNGLGFGALYTESQPVREVADQQDDPDRAAVQRRVVESRKTHYDKANMHLARRAAFRENVADKAVNSGVMTQEERDALPLLEDASMLEAKWYGEYGEKSDKPKTTERQKLYRAHKK